MRSEIKYEWTLETLDSNGDIVDSDFSDSLSFDKGELPGNDLGLVRRIGNEMEGVVEDSWAYVKEGKLPECFSDAAGNSTGVKVPNRFYAELFKYLNE